MQKELGCEILMLRISEITKTYWKPPLCYSYVGSLKFPVGSYPRFTWNTVSLLLRHFHGSKVAWNPIFSLGNNSLDGLNRVEWPLFHKDRWHNHKRQKIIGNACSTVVRGFGQVLDIHQTFLIWGEEATLKVLIKVGVYIKLFVFSLIDLLDGAMWASSGFC